MTNNEQAKSAASSQIELLKSDQKSSASSIHTSSSTHTVASHGTSGSHHGHHHQPLPHHPVQSHPGAHAHLYHPDPEAAYHDTGIDYNHVLMIRNAASAKLYEDALRFEDGTIISSAGALVTSSGKKTGRSPKDKRIVDEPSTAEDIWWGPVNTKLSEHAFLINHERAVDYLNTRERLYVFDGYAGWDPKYRIKIRVVCARAYHCLFMRNMLIRPTDEELENYGEPDFTILNAGAFPANRYTTGMTSTTSVAINFRRKEMVILGTEYAGEMKKGVFTIMHYLMPKAGVLSLHSSANQGDHGDVTLFFGLSGTGKTTLSADPHRHLIGDDEHCWSDTGVFNIEGGCYAKCIDLSAEKEPEIYGAIRYGAVLENVVLDEDTNALIPCIGGHPKNIIMLTCDAFGVLPPVSRLTPAQAMYHFISGYTAKVAGTEEGVTEPEATFSACFGQPFLVLHPTKYASMLADKIQAHKAHVWLVNTGWAGGDVRLGKRIALKYSRAIIDAVHAGALNNVEYEKYPVFGLDIPKTVPNVPAEVLNPRSAWGAATTEFDGTVRKLATLFNENFAKYSSEATDEVIAVGPKI
ncbi:Protein kinase C-like 1 [Podila clonocystis]|nr:Protein kinase C-like 1 [Podila clonocystis]